MLDVLLYIFIIELSTNESFGCIESVFWIGDCLSFGGLANKSFSLFSNGHNRRGSSESLAVFNYFGSASFHDGDTGVCGTKINTNYILCLGLGERVPETFVQEFSKHYNNRNKFIKYFK